MSDPTQSSAVHTGEQCESPGAASGPDRLLAISYCSRAVAPFDALALARLLAQARVDNARHGITGLLVIEGDRFAQWFEGPPAAVERLWHRIRVDRRHAHVQLLGRSTLPMRVFAGWDMQVGWCRSHAASSATEAGVDVPETWLRALRRRADTAVDLWSALAPVETFRSMPPSMPASMSASMSASMPPSVPPSTTAVLPDVPTEPATRGVAPPSIVIDASTDVLSELVRRLVGADATAAEVWIEALRQHGLSCESFFAGLFELAARRLGDLWLDDHCTEVDVTIGLSRLQVLLRRLGREFQDAGGARWQRAENVRSVLVATQPREPHMLAPGLSTAYFARAGWAVDLTFAATDDDLAAALRRRHFDVLDLSLSSVFRRDNRLQDMRSTVRAARRASSNRSLVVMVTGRTFRERPELASIVGADAGYGSASEVVPLARTLLEAAERAPFATVDEMLRDVAVRVAQRIFPKGGADPRYPTHRSCWAF